MGTIAQKLAYTEKWLYTNLAAKMNSVSANVGKSYTVQDSANSLKSLISRINSTNFHKK